MQNFLKNPRRLPNRKQSLKILPKTPGIYVFWQKNTVIYIGKANNLKNRLNSYFAVKLAPKTAKMVSEAEKISYLEVGSELEALLLEAKLIKNYKPRYNFSLKDDKHPLYIKITKDVYPRVLLSRKIQKEEKVLAYFGPFPSSQTVRSVLKMLRRIFPFSDHKLGPRPCFYSHLGLCRPCPSEISHLKEGVEKTRRKKNYRQNILRLRAVLNGKISFVRRDLEKQMRLYAKGANFEEAAKVRSQIQSLDYILQPITDVSLFIENPNLAIDLREKELADLTRILSSTLTFDTKIARIECYDISHLRGTYPAASMVTFINGEPDKNFYRHFRIYQGRGEDDIASMHEVAKRRAKHLLDWGKPDLILVDGGKNQITAFLKIFSPLKIPVIGLAKQRESLIIPQKGSFITLNLKSGPALNLLQRLRNEAHRFARVYHHRLLAAALLTSAAVSDHTKKK